MIIDVTDLNLETLSIGRQYDTERKRRGNRIYKKDWVKIEEVNQIDNKQEYEIKAKVNGNYEDKYDVYLKIIKDTLEKFTCTCQDAEKRKYM